MGAVADRHGRWAALTVTILRMGGSSLLAGLTPAYATMGVPAPVILVLARLLQGLSVGGEFAASTTFLVESAGPGRRGLFSSDSSTCRRRWGGWSPSGIATLLVGTLSDGQMDGWGRRVPFALGAVLSPVGFWIRQGAQETLGAEQRQGPRPGLFEALRRHPRESLLIGGITAGGTIAYCTWTSYLPTYAELNAGIEKSDALLAGTISLPFFARLQPLGGLLSERRPLRWHGPVRGDAVQGAGARGAVPLVRRCDLPGVVGGVSGGCRRRLTHRCGGEVIRRRGPVRRLRRARAARRAVRNRWAIRGRTPVVLP
jgi:MHS family alpha-ketoglutarate permease-like MFS transporter